ncbi:hypothetical protein D3C76_1319140 [compost metagenome]
MREGPLKTRIVLIRGAQQDGLRQLMTGLRLHGEQALEAKHHVAVAKLLAQVGVLDMRGTGALVNILCDKIVMQGAAGAALTAIAA